MAIPSAARARPPVDAVPASVYRAASRSVTRVLVPCYVVLLALAVLESVMAGSAQSLQLAAVALLVVTVPGSVLAADALARLRLDGTLRRMARELAG